MAKSKGTILITGCNGGLGSAIVTRFLNSPQASDYTGAFGVRDPTSATTLRTVVSSARGGSAHEIVSLDLSTLSSVREGARVINDRIAKGELPPIRALVLCAAIQRLKGQTFTADGYETNFGVNYLSNFLLVLLLLKNMDKENGRVVIVNSKAHDPLDARNKHVETEAQKTIVREVDTLARPPKQENKGSAMDIWKAGMRSYGMSKTLMTMFMFELQRRLTADSALSKLSVISLDPGTMSTPIAKDAPFVVATTINYVFPIINPIFQYLQPNGGLRTPSKSAGDILRAVFDEQELGKHPRALYLNGSEVGKVGTEAQDREKQKALWEGSIRYSHIEDEDTVLTSWR